MLVVIGLPERLQEPRRVPQELAADQPVAERRDDLLLATRAGEVALADGLAHAGYASASSPSMWYRPGVMLNPLIPYSL